jgi:hypothetical protein
MSHAGFLPRRLSQSGCVIAGTKLAAHREKLKEQKIKLAAKVDEAARAVIDKTRSLEALTTTDATMIEIDRATDRAIGAFDAQLDGIERSFDHEDILPLEDAEQARLADATLVRKRSLPSGTDFLRLVYSLQWARMNAMVKVLVEKDIAAAIGRLGLSLEADRIARWVALYGAKLGVTEAKNADPAAVAVEAWHEAYGTLVVRVHAEYDDPHDRTQQAVRDLLLGPYEAQAEEERRAEQKVRRRRKPEPGSGSEGAGGG